MVVWEIRAEIELKADNIKDAILEIEKTPLNEVKIAPKITGITKIS